MEKSAIIFGRLLLALVFLYAGIGKLLDLPVFALAIMNYRLVPWPVGIGAAVYLPCLEIAAALGLFTKHLRGGALLLIAILLLVFLGALASAEIRGLDITCGCFGGHSGAILPAFLRNCVLFGMTFLLLTKEKNYA